MFTSCELFADSGTICTERDNPTSIGPITVAPPTACSSRVAIEAECKAGMISTLAVSDQPAERVGRAQFDVEGDVGRHLAVVFEVDAAPVEQPDRLLHVRGALAGRMAERREREQRHSARSRSGARAAASTAMSASSSASALSDGGVGDQHVWPRASTSDMPMTRWPGLGSITRRTSRSATEKLRVTPVTMASASPSATMAAAKWLRSC